MSGLFATGIHHLQAVRKSFSFSTNRSSRGVVTKASFLAHRARKPADQSGSFRYSTIEYPPRIIRTLAPVSSR
jgi:hypothetical protein